METGFIYGSVNVVGLLKNSYTHTHFLKKTGTLSQPEFSKSHGILRLTHPTRFPSKLVNYVGIYSIPGRVYVCIAVCSGPYLKKLPLRGNYNIHFVVGAHYLLKKLKTSNFK